MRENNGTLDCNKTIETSKVEKSSRLTQVRKNEGLMQLKGSVVTSHRALFNFHEAQPRNPHPPLGHAAPRCDTDTAFRKNLRSRQSG